MQAVCSRRRRWSTPQVLMFVGILILGNWLFIKEINNRYEKENQLQLGEYKLKQSSLQHQLDAAKAASKIALRPGGQVRDVNANDRVNNKQGGEIHTTTEEQHHNDIVEHKNGMLPCYTFSFIIKNIKNVFNSIKSEIIQSPF